MENTKYSKICIIVGAGDFDGFIAPPARGRDLVIAADGGFDHLSGLGIDPDIWIGDGDSLRGADYADLLPKECECVKLPCIKDETDMLAAVRLGFERGCTTFHIYGGCGGRFDHTFSNIITLSEIAERGGEGYLYHNGGMMTVIENKGISFPEIAKGMISVFSLSDVSEGVTIKGLKYETDNITLRSTDSVGCSNEFTGRTSAVSVKRGRLLIILPSLQP